jgi:hypothetical protein
MGQPSQRLLSKLYSSCVGTDDPEFGGDSPERWPSKTGITVRHPLSTGEGRSTFANTHTHGRTQTTNLVIPTRFRRPAACIIHRRPAAVGVIIQVTPVPNLWEMKNFQSFVETACSTCMKKDSFVNSTWRGHSGESGTPQRRGYGLLITHAVSSTL